MFVRKFSTQWTLSVHSGIVMRDFPLGFVFHGRLFVFKTSGCTGTFLLYQLQGFVGISCKNLTSSYNKKTNYSSEYKMYRVKKTRVT